MSQLTSFDSHFEYSNLLKVFGELKRRRFDFKKRGPRISPGADRVDLRQFERDLEKHIRAMSRKAVQGRYTFSIALGVDIPKAPGSDDTRPISMNTIRDSIIQRSLYDYLYPVVETRMEDCVYGYRANRSAQGAIGRIRKNLSEGLRFIFDADFTGFFDNVDHELLLNMVGRLGIDERAERLILRYLRTGRADSEMTKTLRDSAAKSLPKLRAPHRSVGVPQGGVLSGLLSNLYLSEFDAQLVRDHRGYVRYADDFVVCCANGEECAIVNTEVRELVPLLKLTLNDKKTRTCVHADDGIDFLGFRVSSGGLSVKESNVRKFKDRIRSLVRAQHMRRNSDSALRNLICFLNFKIRGPDAEACDILRGVGIAHPELRSWIGFFRIIDDTNQLRSLDRWIRSEISRFMWRRYRRRVRFAEMRSAGLISLVSQYYRL